MNKTFYVILVLSILAIMFVSVYLINRKAPLQPFSNQLDFTQIYTPKLGSRVFTAMDTSGEDCDSDGIRIAQAHNRVQNILSQLR